MANPNISFTVVVNTENVPLDNVNPNTPLQSVAQRALAKSESKDRQLSDFDLKDGSGRMLDLDKKVGEAGLTDGAKLYLTLKVGVTG